MGLTVGSNPNANQGTTPSSLALGSHVAAGSVLIVGFQGSGSAPSITVTDNINAGNYNQLALFNSTTQGQFLALYWIVSVAGTPTASASWTGGATLTTCIMSITGFAGTATYDATLGVVQGHNDTAVTSVSVSASTNFNNEAVFAVLGLGGAPASLSFSGWTQEITNLGNDKSFWAQVVATPGAANFTGTLGTAEHWSALVVGVYDQVTAVAPAYFFNSDAEM